MRRSDVWKLLEYQQTIKSPFFDTFLWESEPVLWRELRDAAKLHDEILSLDSEWQQILKLMDWVHHLSKHQGWDEAPEVTGIRLLEGANSGMITFRCVEFAHMLQQICTVYGIPARVIGLRRPGSDNGLGKGHVVIDAWSNDFQKWVVLDPQMNSFYTNREGQPLSAFELHDRVRVGTFDDIVMTAEPELRQQYNPSEMDAKDNRNFDEITVPSGYERQEVWDSIPDDSSFEGFLRFWQEYYYQFAYRRSYSLNRPKSINGSAGANEIYYYAPQELPPIVFQRARQTCEYTCERARIEFPINGVEIQWQLLETSANSDAYGNRTLIFRLSHCMPWFQHYKVVVNGQESTLTLASFEVELSSGDNQISVTPVSQFGKEGKQSVVRIHVAHA